MTTETRPRETRPRPEPRDEVLAAAYTCFTRNGLRRTTMGDIACEAGMSCPAVGTHVRNKDDAFRRVVEVALGCAWPSLAARRPPPNGKGPRPTDRPTDRLVAVPQTKLLLGRVSDGAAEPEVDATQDGAAAVDDGELVAAGG